MKKNIFLIFLLVIVFNCSKREFENAAQKPNLIILSPEIAEIVCAIGGEKNIIAVTNECDYPEILKSKEKVGSFSSQNIEKIVSLQPNMVFASGLEQQIIKKRLIKLGINVYQFYPENIDDLLKTILKIGNLIEKEKNASEIIKNFLNNLPSIQENRKKPKMYVEIYNKPIMTASAESFVGDIIEKSGGTNLFQNLPRDYCRVSAESVVEKNPDIILITCPKISKSEIKNRLGWQNISAIKSGQIYTSKDIDMDLIVRAGPRSINGIKILSKIFRDFYEK